MSRRLTTLGTPNLSPAADEATGEDCTPPRGVLTPG